MSADVSLVDYLVDSKIWNIDTSKARRLIVEGKVKVNGEVVEDPAFRLSFVEGFTVEVDTKTPDSPPAKEPV